MITRNNIIHSLALFLTITLCGASAYSSDFQDPKLDAIVSVKAHIERLQKELSTAPSEKRHEIETWLSQLHSREIEECRAWTHETTSPPDEETSSAITAFVSGDTDEPIMRIRMCGKHRAIVDTGAIQGPLAGSGHEYYIIFTTDKWQVACKIDWIS